MWAALAGLRWGSPSLLGSPPAFADGGASLHALGLLLFPALASGDSRPGFRSGVRFFGCGGKLTPFVALSSPSCLSAVHLAGKRHRGSATLHVQCSHTRASDENISTGWFWYTAAGTSWTRTCWRLDVCCSALSRWRRFCTQGRARIPSSTRYDGWPVRGTGVASLALRLALAMWPNSSLPVDASGDVVTSSWSCSPWR